MLIEREVSRVSLNCSDKEKNFSYTFSNIAADATDAEVFELATALNSVQETVARRITRTVISKLVPSM
jgi:hypothetical protein